jgi:hypothetical protein
MQCGAAKYCEGVEDVGEEDLGAVLHHQPWRGTNPGVSAGSNSNS